MTGDEAVKLLNAIASGDHYSHRTESYGLYTSDGKPICYDAEEQHRHADDVLCDLLMQLGYDDVVKAWRDVPKWYA